MPPHMRSLLVRLQVFWLILTSTTWYDHELNALRYTMHGFWVITRHYIMLISQQTVTLSFGIVLIGVAVGLIAGLG